MNNKLKELSVKCSTAVREILEPVHLSISDADEVIDMLMTYFVGNSLMQVKLADQIDYLQCRLMSLSVKLENAALAIHSLKCKNCSEEHHHHTMH